MRYLFLSIVLLACQQSATLKQTADSETSISTAETDSSDYYQYGSRSYDGTGKYYMGREISQVMGHLGAEWLERPEREREERGSLLLAALELQSHHIVADIGAGSGYFTFLIAPLVPEGKVLAVDIQEEMLSIMQAKQATNGLMNVEMILGTEQDPRLPRESVDLVLMVDVYHEFSYPREMMEQIVGALKPDGRVVLVEYRGEDSNVPIKPRHKMTASQAEKEMQAVGLHLIENKAMLPRQHCLIFGVYDQH